MSGNMSHCRFENTLAALRECEKALEEADGTSELSESEKKAASRLLLLCARMGYDWASEIKP